jgi:sugar O-acyltransferase (sialic acid O-acetyltransferase NeuD family)
MHKIAVVGAGGFGREVKWLISEINADSQAYEFLGFVVSDLAKLGDHDSKDEVLGDYGWLKANRGKVDCLAMGIGTPAVRLKVAEDLKGPFPELKWPVLVHPSVRFRRQCCQLGEGVLLCAGVIGTVNLRLERFALVNLACTLGHEAVIGEGSVLNPNVNISGGVKIRRGVYIGTGAQVLQYITVGDGATIGAGAVVTKDVPPGVTVVGIPAKPVR